MFSTHEEEEPLAEMNATFDQLYQNEETFDAKRKAAMLQLLQQLAADDCRLINYDWTEISKKFHAAEIPQHPRQIQNSEVQLDKIIEEYHKLSSANTSALNIISSNLFHLGSSPFSKTKHKLLHDVILLEKIITRRRLLNSAANRDSMGELKNFRNNYKLSFMDKIIRYAIGFNSGLNTASSVFSVMTTIFLNTPVMIVTGVTSLILSLSIAQFYANSYLDEDNEFETILKNYEKKIYLQIQEESMLRLQCYKLMTQKIVLLKQCQNENIDMIRDQRKLKALINNIKINNPITELDKFIDNKLEIYHDVSSRYVEDKPIEKENSIYIRVFRSKYWGPFLNFLSAGVTSFGVSKTILFMSGVTGIMGSSLILFGVLAAGALVISTLFALKHLEFNLITAEKSDYLKKFKNDRIDAAEIKIGQLERFKQDISNDLTYMNSITQQRSQSSVSLNSLSIPRSMPTLDMPTSATILTGQYGMFRENSEPAPEQTNTPVLKPHSLSRLSSVSH